jgi:hypothetical protein
VPSTAATGSGRNGGGACPRNETAASVTIGNGRAGGGRTVPSQSTSSNPLSPPLAPTDPTGDSSAATASHSCDTAFAAAASGMPLDL